MSKRVRVRYVCPFCGQNHPAEAHASAIHRPLNWTPRTTARRNPSLADAAWLRALYEGKGYSLEAIAREAECSRSAVALALREHGIPIRRRGQRRARA